MIQRDVEPHVAKTIDRCRETLRWRAGFPLVPCELPIHPDTRLHEAWAPGGSNYGVRLHWQTHVVLDEPEGRSEDDQRRGRDGLTRIQRGPTS